MANEVKEVFLAELAKRYSPLKKIPGSYSLIELGENGTRIYIRYSRVHSNRRTFYGLRKGDLKNLEGRSSIIVFLWDDQKDPLCVLFSDYEEVFNSLLPASDGQFKAQIYLGDEATELYIANAGRFNVEGNFGWHVLERGVARHTLRNVPTLSHSQVQALLGSIGTTKGYDVWIPQNDRLNLDCSHCTRYPFREKLFGFDSVQNVLQEIDVIWMQKGSSDIRAMFEVEHTTPIYSGLLRFNDIHLLAPVMKPRFTVVANEERRALFTRQITRPTFQISGLANECTFLECAEVYSWHQRLNKHTVKGAERDMLS